MSVTISGTGVTGNSGTGVKHDGGKVRVDLLSFEAMEEIAKVMTFGASKYGDDNWRGGMEWRRLIGAALRHLFAFSRGEDRDPESGLPHLAHAGCCIMFLIEYYLTGNGKDNRYVRKAEITGTTSSTGINSYTLLACRASARPTETEDASRGTEVAES